MDHQEEEAMRRFRNAEADSARIRSMLAEIAQILTYGCTQACAARGVHLSESDAEKLQDLLEGFL